MYMNSDPLVSPANSDKRWRELVKNSNKPHPFQPQTDKDKQPRFASARNTAYNSQFSSGSKREYIKRVLSVEVIPPAGRSSFFREQLRPENVDLAKNSEYQKLLQEHMRTQQSTGSSTGRSSTLTSMNS